MAGTLAEWVCHRSEADGVALLVRDPVAVEAKRDPGGQVDPGDRFAAEVLRGQDDEVGGTPVGVVDEGHDVAVVLGGGSAGGDEDGLPGGGVAAELVRLRGAAGQVVLEQGISKGLVGDVTGQRDEGLVDLADNGAVAVAVRPGQDPLVDPGKLLEPVVELAAGDPPGRRVQGSPVPCDGPFQPIAQDSDRQRGERTERALQGPSGQQQAEVWRHRRAMPLRQRCRRRPAARGSARR